MPGAGESWTGLKDVLGLFLVGRHERRDADVAGALTVDVKIPEDERDVIDDFVELEVWSWDAMR